MKQFGRICGITLTRVKREGGGRLRDFCRSVEVILDHLRIYGLILVWEVCLFTPE